MVDAEAPILYKVKHITLSHDVAFRPTITFAGGGHQSFYFTYSNAMSSTTAKREGNEMDMNILWRLARSAADRGPYSNNFSLSTFFFIFDILHRIRSHLYSPEVL